VPLRDAPLLLSLFVENRGNVGDDPASSLRPRLPPLGGDAVDVVDDLALSGDGDGIPTTIAFVVGIRKAAEGSYFFRITDGFRDAPLVPLATGDMMLLSSFSVAGVEGLFGRVCDLVFTKISVFSATGVETTGDSGVLVRCVECGIDTPGDVLTLAVLLWFGDWGFPFMVVGDFDSLLSFSPYCTGS